VIRAALIWALLTISVPAAFVVGALLPFLIVPILMCLPLLWVWHRVDRAVADKRLQDRINERKGLR
jgi:predicted DNA repair protein MutK